MALGLGILRRGPLLALAVVSSWEVRAAWGQAAPPQRLRRPAMTWRMSSVCMPKGIRCLA